VRVPAVSKITDKLLSPVCECSKALPPAVPLEPLLELDAEPEPVAPAEPAPPLPGLTPQPPPPPAPPFPPPEDGLADEFEPEEPAEPLAPMIVPLLVMLIVVPLPQPVSVFIAGVELLLELTVTPLLIVNMTGVF
jgi:hypothetical protein